MLSARTHIVGSLLGLLDLVLKSAKEEKHKSLCFVRRFQLADISGGLCSKVPRTRRVASSKVVNINFWRLELEGFLLLLQTTNGLRTNNKKIMKEKLACAFSFCWSLSIKS